MTPEATQARNPGKNKFGQSDIFHTTLRRYGLLMYAPTNKNQYKKGRMCAMKVLYDSEPNVRAILTELRTYRESSAPCVAEELDMMEEKVPTPPAFVCSALILFANCRPMHSLWKSCRGQPSGDARSLPLLTKSQTACSACSRLTFHTPHLYPFTHWERADR